MLYNHKPILIVILYIINKYSSVLFLSYIFTNYAVEIHIQIYIKNNFVFNSLSITLNKFKLFFFIYQLIYSKIIQFFFKAILLFKII